MKKRYERLLVTGAGGFIGSHVALSAVRAGYAVQALIRPASPGRALLERQGVKLIVGDMMNEGDVRQALAGCDAVVHCAAQVGDWGASKTYRQANVVATKMIADAAAAKKVKRFVLMSSLGVYAARHHYGTDETTPPASRGLDAYTRTKAEAEAVVRAASSAERMSAVILRPGFVYGPRDRHVLPQLISTLKSGRFAYIGDGQRRLDQIFIGNLVDAVFLALDAPPSLNGEAFNVTDPELVTRREFVGTVARLSGLPEPTLCVPVWPAYLLTQLLDRGGRLLNLSEPPMLSKARYKFLALNLEFSIEKAKSHLGYAPTRHFAEAMAETIAALSI